MLTALVTVASGADETEPVPQRGRWNDPAAMHRRPWLPGPGGWRAAVR